MKGGHVRAMLGSASFALGALLLFAGCAARTKPDPPTPVEPVSPFPNGPREDAMPAVEAMPMDSTLADPRAIPSASRGTNSGRRITPPPVVGEAPADSLPPPTISVRLSDDERAGLMEEAARNLRAARDALTRLELKGPNESMRESIATLRDLVESALATEGQGDLQAAAQLARKARLLAEELLAR
jgi:hypothetical protein